MTLFSAFAFSIASSPHGNQSTGLWACCKRYGDFSLINRLVCIGSVFDAYNRSCCSRFFSSGRTAVVDVRAETDVSKWFFGGHELCDLKTDRQTERQKEKINRMDKTKTSQTKSESI